MDWIIPGTTLTAKREDAYHIEDQFKSMFLAGGMVLSQVSNITGLESHTVQNWVKRGFLTNPKQKRYTLRQLCRIININMLKGVLPMDRVCGMLHYVNGRLDDESDDAIDDSQLYCMFVKLAARIRELTDEKERESMTQRVMEDYKEPYPGARHRVEQVLRIMLTAWVAGRMRQEAEIMLDDLSREGER